MLFEANWQLLLKWNSLKGFLPCTEQAGTLVEAQGGGCKGRSAVDQATQQIIETEIMHMNQTPTIDLYLDLRTCFDLMVEACHNLACRCHGATDAYLKLHACTHQVMWYYVQHKFGVSQEYNTFDQHPWHGAGQGAVEVALQYIILSDTLIDTYHTKVALHMLHNPTQNLEILQSLKAFIDDVILHAKPNQPNQLDDLQHQAQAQLQWWVQLVQVTGRALNLKKCCGIAYQWVLDKWGILKLVQLQLPPNYISLHNGQTLTPIPFPKISEGTQYFGIYIIANRNTNPMEQHLWTKATSYLQAFHSTAMDCREVNVLYCSCFLPVLTYPLLAMWMPDQFFEKLHGLLTTMILNKMGCH